MRKLLLFCSLVYTTLFAQAQEKEIYGKVSYTEMNESYSWFSQGHAAYKPQKKAVKSLSNKISDYRFIVFAAAWCPDTRSLLPEFYKALHASGYPEDQISLYLLDHSKTSPERTEAAYEIHAVPTFIILKGDDELGRIVESVDNTIEEELLKYIK